MGGSLKTAIIILNYNGDPYILDCLKSLEGSDIGQFSTKIVVVDNASEDQSVAKIKDKFPQVKLIINQENLGFSSGNNQGIAWALDQGFDSFMLLNPDTVVNQVFLGPLLELIESDGQIGIVAPLLRGKEGDREILALGASFNPVLGRTEHLHLELDSRPSSPLEQELVSGCAMLVKRSVFEKIGLLDERFFLYFEDSDFCLRARQAGFKVFVQPASAVLHLTSRSFGGLSFLKVKNVLWSNFLFILKHVWPGFWPLAFAYLAFLGLKLIGEVVFKSLEK